MVFKVEAQLATEIEKINIFGFIPARMAASRFPGKPLQSILGRPMVEHCVERAKLYPNWDYLALTTCDEEIRQFGISKNYNVVMTSDSHTRALDRVAEAMKVCQKPIKDSDVILCVQGDEPLLGPDLIKMIVDPLIGDNSVNGTILAVPIVDEETFLNPDTVKLVHNINFDVLYTSRSPIPYTKKFSEELGALRVGGIFGFKWGFLKWFTNQSESPLEVTESCDSNRIYDGGFTQRAVIMPYRKYFSVDSPGDLKRVEEALLSDKFSQQY